MDPRIAGVARTFRILDTGYCLNEDKSTRYHRLRRRADLLGTAVAGVLLLGLLLSGGAHRLRELAAAIAQWAPGGMEEAMTVVVMTIVMMIILQIVEFPFAFYQGYLLEHRYGLSTQSRSHWMTDQAKGVALGLVLAVAGTSVIYLALRESPDHWWWISAAVFALATIGLARIAPVVLLPIFYKFKPLDRPALVDRLMALATRARTDVVGVFEWVLSGHTRKANAALAGMGRTRRILLSDTLLADYSEDEIEVILAHELAHHVHRDLWRGIAVQSGMHGRRVLRRRVSSCAPLPARSRLRGVVRSRRTAAADARRRRVVVPGCCRSPTPCRARRSAPPTATRSRRHAMLTRS